MAFGGANLGSAVGQILVETDKAVNNIAKLRNNLGQFHQQTQTVGFGLSQLAGGLLGIGAALTGFIAAGVKIFADFETGMRNVASISPFVANAFDDISESVLDIARNSARAPEELANALYSIVSAGIDGSEAMEILAVAADAANAGLTSTANAAQVLTGVINSGIKGSADGMLTAAEASDILFQTVEQGVFTYEQLTGQIGDNLALASELGVSLEELGAAYATLTQQSVPLAESATQINAIFNALIKPTDSLKQILTDHGFSSGVDLLTRGFDGQTGLAGALAFFMEVTGGSADQLELLTGNIRGIKGIVGLTTGDLEVFNKQLAGMEDAAGSTAAALEQQQKAISFTFRELGVALQIAAIKFIEPIVPAIKLLTDAITLLVEVVTSIPTPFREAISIFIAASGAAFLLAGAVATILARVYTIRVALAALGLTFGQVFAPVRAIIIMLALFGAALSILLPFVKDFFGGLLKPISDLNNAIGVLFDNIKQLFTIKMDDKGAAHMSKAYRDVFEALAPLLGGQGARAVSVAFTKLHKSARLLGNVIQVAGRALGDFFDIVSGRAVAGQTAKFVDRLRLIFGPAASRQILRATWRLRNAFKTFGKELRKAFDLPDTGNLLIDLFTKLIEKSGQLFDVLRTKVIPAIGPILAKSIDIAAAAITFLSRGIDDVARIFGGIGDLIFSVVSASFGVLGALLIGDFSLAWDRFKSGVLDIAEAGINLLAIIFSFDAFDFNHEGTLSFWDQFKIWLNGEVGGDNSDFEFRDGSPYVPLGTLTLNIKDFIVTGATNLVTRFLEFISDAFGGSVFGDRTGGPDMENPEYVIPLLTINVRDWFVTGVTNLALKVQDFVYDLLNLGKEGVASGNQGGVSIFDVVVAIGSWVVDETEPLVLAILTFLREKINQALDLVSEVGRLFGGWVLDVAAPTAVNIVGDVGQAIKDELVAFKPKVVNFTGWVLEVGEGAVDALVDLEQMILKALIGANKEVRAGGLAAGVGETRISNFTAWVFELGAGAVERIFDLGDLIFAALFGTDPDARRVAGSIGQAPDSRVENFTNWLLEVGVPATLDLIGAIGSFLGAKIREKLAAVLPKVGQFVHWVLEVALPNTLSILGDVSGWLLNELMQAKPYVSQFKDWLLEIAFPETRTLLGDVSGWIKQKLIDSLPAVMDFIDWVFEIGFPEAAKLAADFAEKMLEKLADFDIGDFTDWKMTLTTSDGTEIVVDAESIREKIRTAISDSFNDFTTDPEVLAASEEAGRKTARTIFGEFLTGFANGVTDLANASVFGEAGGGTDLGPGGEGQGGKKGGLRHIIFAYITGLVQETGEIIDEWIEGTDLQRALEDGDIGQAFIEVMEAIWNEIAVSLENAINTFLDLGVIDENAVKYGKWIANGFTSALEPIFRTPIIVTDPSGAPGHAVEGESIFDSILNGINGFFGDVAEWVRGIKAGDLDDLDDIMQGLSDLIFGSLRRAFSFEGITGGEIVDFGESITTMLNDLFFGKQKIVLGGPSGQDVSIDTTGIFDTIGAAVQTAFEDWSLTGGTGIVAPDFGWLFDKIVEGIGLAFGGDPDAFVPITDWLGRSYRSLVNWIKDNLPSPDLPDWIEDPVGWLKGKIQGAEDELPGDIPANPLHPGVAGRPGGIGFTGPDASVDIVQDVVPEVTALSGAFGIAMTSIAGSVSGILLATDKLRTGTEEDTEETSSSVGSLARDVAIHGVAFVLSVMNVMRAFGDALVSGAATARSRFSSAIGQLVGIAAGQLVALYFVGLNGGVNLGIGLAQGVVSAYGTVARAVAGLVVAAEVALLGALVAASPSKLFSDIGQYVLAAGFAQGIGLGTPVVTNATENMVLRAHQAALERAALKTNVGAGTMGSGRVSSGPTTIYVTIPVEDLAEIKTVNEFFTHLPRGMTT